MVKIEIEKTLGEVIIVFSFFLFLLSLFNVFRVSPNPIYFAEVIVGYLIFLIITGFMYPLKEEYFDFQKIPQFWLRGVRRTISFGLIGGMILWVYFIMLFKFHGFAFTLGSIEIYEQSEISQIISSVFLSIGSGILTALGGRLYQYYK